MSRGPASFDDHRDAYADGRFVRVVNYHNTPHARRSALRDELALYAQRFVSLGLDDLDSFFATGQWDDPRPGFLPVFYEGFRNGAEVAAAVCDELGLTGWFMICTGFLDCPPASQEVYARSHEIELHAEDLAIPGRRLAMSWDDVARIGQRHVVCAHTASHAALADVLTDADIEREITAPAAAITAATGRPVPAFVWKYGNPWGMNPRLDRAVADAGYRYLFSNTTVHRLV